MVAVEQETVVRDLHRDRRESLANAAGAEVSGDRAQHTVPVEAVMLIEPAVFGRDERFADVQGHDADRHVDAADVLQVPEKAAVAVVDVAAFAGMEGADLDWARATVEATRAEPGVESDHARAGH